MFCERDVISNIAKHGMVTLIEPLSEYIDADFAFCSPNEDFMAALEKMDAAKQRHLPVLLRKQLVGVVSMGDLANARLQLLGLRPLKGYAEEMR